MNELIASKWIGLSERSELIYQKMGFGQIAKSHFSRVELYTKAEYHESIKVKSNNELQKLK